LVDNTLAAEVPTLLDKTDGKVKLLCGIIKSLISRKKKEKLPKEHGGLVYCSQSST